MQIDEDIQHEMLKWQIEKWGKIVMLAVIVFSLIGLLGPGLLSDQKTSNKYISVRYNFFEHNETPGKYEISINNSEFTNDSSIIISLNNSIIKKIDIKKITPESDKSIFSGGKINYIFKTTARN